MDRKLKARIIQHYGSQGAFAEALGVHESNVSLILSGKRQLNREKAEQWGSLLKCKPSILLNSKAQT